MKSFIKILLALIFFISQNIYAQSVLESSTLLSTKGDTAIELFNKANNSYEKEDYENAISLYISLVRSSEKNISTESLKKLALSYSQLKKVDLASKYAEDYIKKTYKPDFLKSELFRNIENSESFKSLKERYLPKANPWLFFYLYSGLVGLFIAFIINLKKKNTDKKATTLISLYILLHSLFIIHVCLFLSNFHFLIPHSMYTTASFSFLYGPLLYFYFKRIIENYEFKLKDLLHLLPSLILILYMLPLYLLSGDEKLHLMFNRDQILKPTTAIIVILKSISLITYAFLIYKTFIKSRKKSSQPEYNNMTWKKNLVILNFIYVVSYLFYGAIITKVISIDFLIHPQIISMSLIVLFVGYSAYVNPYFFKKNESIDFNGIDKYKKSGLTHSYSIELREQLMDLFVNDKIFKEHNINLDILSEKLNTTRHNTSQVINEHFNLNFFELINKFRIEEAKKILKNDPHKNLNIIDVAYDVGFNNKVTFNKAFKKETGFTPTQFLKNIEKNPESKLSVNYFRRGKIL